MSLSETRLALAVLQQSMLDAIRNDEDALEFLTTENEDLAHWLGYFQVHPSRFAKVMTVARANGLLRPLERRLHTMLMEMRDTEMFQHGEL